MRIQKKKNIKNISWDDKASQELFSQYKNQPTKGIVEKVLSGSTLKVLIGENIVTLHLTGVQCPSLKKEEKEEDKENKRLAKEIKLFTELKLLQRDVTIILESVDKFQFLCGSIALESNKCFQEELLSKGYAKIVEWNVGTSKFATSMRKAEQEAKKKKLKLFKNYQPPKSSLNEEDKKQFQALVLQVLSGDSLRVKHLDNTGKEERIFLSSVTAPKFVNSKKEYEPYAFESKEFLRKKVAEQNNLVTIKIDYKKTFENKEQRKYATVTSGKKNVSFELLQNGLASTSRHSNNDERSPFYDKLTKYENLAKEGKKGKHETKSSATENFSLNDLTSKKENLEDHNKMLNLMKDRKTPAIVDKVLSGSRFKLILPKHNSVVIFGMSGISSKVGGNTKEDAPYQEESLIFSTKKIGNKDIDVLIERIDKAGNFLGQVFVGEDNYAEAILKEGLAYINHNIANKFKNYNDLVKAENSAKNDKKNIFSLSEDKIYGNDNKSKKFEKTIYSKDIEPSKSSEPFSIRITEFVDPIHFYLQTPEAAEDLENIDKVFSELKLDDGEAYQPKNGELCICKFSQDGNWYRAKCNSSDKEKDSFMVTYIDYGNKETTKSSNIRKIVESLTKIPILAKEGFLAFTRSHKNKFKSEALEYVREFCEGKELLARHEYTIGNRVYLSILDENNSRNNLNSDLIRNGLVFFDDREEFFSNNQFEKQVKLLSKDEEAAKRERINLFEDGDIYGNSEDEE